MDITKIEGIIPYTYRKGDYMFRQGDSIDHMYYMATGKCYRMILKADGEENIHTYWGAGTYIGAFALIYGREHSLNNVIAVTRCEGYKIPKHIFLDYIENNPEITKKLLIRAIDEINDFQEQYIYLKKKKIGNRVCQLLLQEARLKNDTYVIKRGYRYAEVAKYLGVHKVTISKIMKALKEENLIEKKSDGIHLIGYDRVVAYAEGEKFHYK